MEQSRIDHFVILQSTVKDKEIFCLPAYDTSTGQLYMLKIYDLSNPDTIAMKIDSFKNEVQVYQNLSHPNLVTYFKSKPDAIWFGQDAKQTQVAYLVLEYVRGGQLFDYTNI